MGRLIETARRRAWERTGAQLRLKEIQRDLALLNDERVLILSLFPNLSDVIAEEPLPEEPKKNPNLRGGGNPKWKLTPEGAAKIREATRKYWERVKAEKAAAANEPHDTKH